MLKKLTERLIKEDIEKSENKLLSEAIVIPTEFSKISRYSLLDESVCCECGDIKTALLNVTFSDMDTLDDRKAKLYKACTCPESLNESITTDEKTKRLTMTREDYKIIKNSIDTYKKTKDPEVKSLCKKKFKTFISTVKANLSKASEENPVDAFINSALNSLCKILCDGAYVKKGSDNQKDIVLAKIYMINKKLNSNKEDKK